MDYHLKPIVIELRSAGSLHEQRLEIEPSAHMKSMI